jgi:excisionase family DNA binding protein
MESDHGYITAKEVAKTLRISTIGVYRLVKTGRISAYKFGARRLRIDRRDLDDFIRSAKVQLNERGIEYC